MVELLRLRGIKALNDGLAEPRYRTVVNFIFGDSRERMQELAFGSQAVNYDKGADNSAIVSKPDFADRTILEYNGKPPMGLLLNDFFYTYYRKSINFILFRLIAGIWIFDISSIDSKTTSGATRTFERNISFIYFTNSAEWFRLPTLI